MAAAGGHNGLFSPGGTAVVTASRRSGIESSIKAELSQGIAAEICGADKAAPRGDGLIIALRKLSDVRRYPTFPRERGGGGGRAVACWEFVVICHRAAVGVWRSL